MRRCGRIPGRAGSHPPHALSMLLICSLVAVAVCLVSVQRLFSRARALDRTTGELDRANRELDQANRELDRANRELTARNAELNVAAEAKARFVASLSHELRNPLGAVTGFAELLEDGRAGELTPRQREHLGIIRTSAEHVLGLADELLDIARIEAGHIRLAPEPIDPAGIAAACTRALTPLAMSRDIGVELIFEAAGLVVLDPGRLRQVMLNYLSNAIKFAPGDSVVTLRLSQPAADRLRLEVSDRGIGIAIADQDRIFDEFVQVPGSERLGTGLGLAITKLIVGAQGGEVGVDSTPGQGSTFYAELPAPARGFRRQPTIQITRRQPALAEA